MTAAPLPTHRSELMQRLARPGRYDVAVIGGGATGLGVALDAAVRGLKVLLLEAHDFTKDTYFLKIDRTVRIYRLHIIVILKHIHQFLACGYQ